MALKDKLMTLEDFKAVRDVDVASNSAQFTEIRADLNATNGDINKLIGNIQGTWNLGGMYSATGIEYNSSNYIRTPFIKVNPGDTIQIANPDTTLEFSVYEFASNAPTTTGTNERLQITYVGSSVKKVTLGNSTNYIRLQLSTGDTLKGDGLLLYSKNSVVFDSIDEVSENLSETLETVKSAFNAVEGANILSFESGGLYSATGIEYTDATKSRTGFIKVTPGSRIVLLYNITGVTSIAVFGFASDTPTSTGVNECTELIVAYNEMSVSLSASTNYIRVQVNVATSDIINPIIMCNGGYVDSMFDNALHFKGVLPSGSVNIAADMTGIWQLITANSYTDIPQSYDSGWLEVIKTNNWVLQRFINGKANGIWLRRSTSGGSSWSTWINISKDIDLLYTYAGHESWTHRGVTFTWNSDNTVCTAVGTNDGTNPSASRFYANQYGMPSWIEPGKTYYLTYESTGVAPSFFIELFSNETSIFQKAYRKNDAIRIPLNTTGITLRLNVASGATVNGTVSVRFDEMMPNSELSKELYDSKTFGIDFLRTYGNRTNSSSHGVSYTSVASVSCKYHIAGTVSSSESSDSTYSVYYGAIPAGIEDGDKLIVQLQTEPAGMSGLGMLVTYYDASIAVLDRVYNYNLRMDLPLTIPEASKYMRITLFVAKGNTVDVTTEVKLVKLRPQKMDVPLIISFVDDDISNDTYVTKFHDACLHNSIVGNYAVITKNITDGNTTLEKLLDYEDEGFGMLIHCWKQVYPANTSPWVPQQRTKAQTDECRANLAKGLRDMREMGFVNYNHWITPGGRIEADLQAMGRQFGLLSMASIGNGRHNTMQDLNRYYIKRLSLHPIDDTPNGSVAGIKDYIDKCVADNLGGWLIITTHFNEWGNLTWDATLDANGYPIGYSRFNEVVQYALTKGLIPMSYQEAWTYYQSILESNREAVDEANS